MPILIRGNGGAKELPTLKVYPSGSVEARTKKGAVYHALNEKDDADFVAGNIKSGVNIFGKLGTFKGYERVTGIGAVGSTSVVVPCSFKPKAILLIPYKIDQTKAEGLTRGVCSFGHFPEYNLFVDQKYSRDSNKYYSFESSGLDASAFTGTYTVQYSDNSVSVTIIDSRYAFISEFDAIIFG